MVWTKAKVNYRFIFEYNTRHTLEWRQLLEVRFYHRILTELHSDSSLGFMFFSFSSGIIYVAQFLMG